MNTNRSIDRNKKLMNAVRKQLARSGVKVKLFIVSEKGTAEGRVVCISKNGDETYAIISDGQVKDSREKSLTAAVEKYYPEWERLELLDERLDCLGWIFRDNKGGTP